MAILTRSDCERVAYELACETLIRRIQEAWSILHSTPHCPECERYLMGAMEKLRLQAGEDV